MPPIHRPQPLPGPQGRGTDPIDSEEVLVRRFKPGLLQAPYFSTGRTWADYLPAYRYGQRSQRRHAGARFEDVEPGLACDWATVRAHSRLGWVEARGAVEDAFSRCAQEAAGESETRQDWHRN